MRRGSLFKLSGLIGVGSELVPIAEGMSKMYYPHGVLVRGK